MPELIGLIGTSVLLVISIAINAALGSRLALLKRTEDLSAHNRTRLEAAEVRMAVVESRLGGIERQLIDGFVDLKLMLKEHLQNDKAKAK